MANTDPTSDGSPVALDLSAEHKTILRDILASCLEGLRGDLETPERMRDPKQARQEAEAYERLLTGLERGEVFVPDETAREALEAIATVTSLEVV